jgi:hypothetical protein
VLNFLELAATRDEQRRQTLLQCANAFGQGNRLLDFPNELLRRTALAYFRGKDEIESSIGPKHNAAWAAFLEPHLIDEPTYHKILQAKSREEKWLSDQHHQARAALKERRESAYHPLRFIKRSLEDKAFIADFFNHLLTSLGQAEHALFGHELLAGGYWRSYFSALVLDVYNQSSTAILNAPAAHPGGVDVQQATYLYGHDFFVTRDIKQKRFLQQRREDIRLKDTRNALR